MTGYPPSRNYLRKRSSRWPMIFALAVSAALAGLLVLMLVGCSTRNKRGRIKAGEVAVNGIANAGTPATLDTSNEGEVLEIPAGSTLVVTETEAVPAAQATESTPAVQAEPAKKVTEVFLSGTTNWKRNKATVRADTGTIDTTVAKHAQDVAERRWLLWTAIACGIGGIVVRSLLPAWPALSNGLLLAAVAAGLAWKLADVPSWIWLAVLGIMGAIVMGYKRAEWDADRDGVPDILQRNRTQAATAVPKVNVSVEPASSPANIPPAP